MPPRCSACCWSAPSVEPLPQSFHNANLIPRLGPSDCAFGSFGPDQGRFTSATILYMALSPTAMHQTVVERATPPRLSPERCRTLLREAKNGYLALSRSALPIVLPVSCALDGESLFLRAGPGSLDRITGQPGIVAFGTTMTSADGTCRSEILVQGRAENVREPATDVPPRLPLINSSQTTVIRVTLELLTGWQYGPGF